MPIPTAQELSTLPTQELVRIIFTLHDRIVHLETQITELKAQEKHTDDHPPTPTQKHPSWVKANKKKKRKARKKARRENFARLKSTPTKTVYHTFTNCPRCGNTALGTPQIGYVREILEVPVVPIDIIHHMVMKRWCRGCKTQVMPSVDFSSLVPGRQRFGIRFTSLVNFLREECQQPLTKIQRYFSVLYNFSISQGGLIGLLHATSAAGKPHYDNLKKQIRGSPYVYGDETGGRENGKNGYHWNFNTDTVQYVTYRKTRSGKVVKHVLGEDFEGVIASDFYGGYNIHTGFHQRCWVHLLGDMKELLLLYPKDKKLKRWYKRVKQIYEEAKAWRVPEGLLPGVLHQTRIAKQRYFEDKLRTIVFPYVKTETPMAGLSARMTKFLQELFVFIRVPGVASDNNSAERAVRHLVTWRKISGGTRSKNGSETKSILTSLFGTWRLQGLNPFQQCQLLLTGNLPLYQ